MTLLFLRWWKPDQTLALLWVRTCRMIWMGVFPDLVHPPGREADVVFLATPSSATQRMPAQGMMWNCFKGRKMKLLVCSATSATLMAMCHLPGLPSA